LRLVNVLHALGMARLQSNGNDGRILSLLTDMEVSAEWKRKRTENVLFGSLPVRPSQGYCQ
jgi:hypothetical protein